MKSLHQFTLCLAILSLSSLAHAEQTLASIPVGSPITINKNAGKDFCVDPGLNSVSFAGDRRNGKVSQGEKFCYFVVKAQKVNPYCVVQNSETELVIDGIKPDILEADPADENSFSRQVVILKIGNHPNVSALVCKTGALDVNSTTGEPTKFSTSDLTRVSGGILSINPLTTGTQRFSSKVSAH